MEKVITFVMIILLCSCETEMPIQVRYNKQPINKVYTVDQPIGTSEFNPRYVPILTIKK